MKFSSILGAFALVALSTTAFANDTTAQLGTGGLMFVTNENIQMATEDLYVSPTQVKVTYKFNNVSDKDQHILVAFPMPDIEGSGDFMTDVPANSYEGDPKRVDDPDNLFGFKTTFNGAPVEAKLYQYAFSNNIDYSEMLRGLGVPLEPFGSKTITALNGLTDEQHQKLTDLGLILNMQYDVGDGMQDEWTPMWTLKSTYSWEATFKPGESDVVHTYVPSVGGTVATTFMPRDDDGGYSEARFKEYQAKYCVDDNLVKALKKAATTEDGYTNYPYYEHWISYIWSTGANWSGTVSKFTLTVDKGDESTLVSFCGDGVKKIGPTTFQFTANDWYPPDGKELEILLLKKMDPVQ